MQCKICLFLILLFVSGISFAQTKIFTDRPNVTDAVSLIPKRTFQIEAGYLNQYYNEDNLNYHFITIPNLNFKYGLSNRIELRLLSSYNLLKYGSESDESGLSPITLSPKLKIIDQDFYIPSVTLAGNITLPDIGAGEFQTEKVNYGFRVLLEHVFSDNYSWAHGFGADWDDEQETTWAYSSALGRSVSDDISVFAELYGYFAKDINSQHGFNTGLTYTLSNNLQVDGIVGIPLNEYAPDFLYGFGLSWKTGL